MPNTADQHALPGRNGPIRVLFFLYVLFLLWAVLWKFNLPFVGDGSLRVINLIPFSGNLFSEMRINVLIFAPLGLYLSVLAPRWTVIKRVFTAALTSIALEAAQYILSIGHSDVTDILLNTLGGMLGIAVYYVLRKLFGKHAGKAVLAVCAAITVLEALLAVAFTVRFKLR